MTAKNKKYSGHDYNKDNKHDHVTPVLMSLHVLPVEFRLQYKLHVTVLKALYATSPS